MIAIASHADGAVLAVLAHPGSKCNAVLGERDGALRVAVTAPPEKGKANFAIQSVLAEQLGCKAAQVALLSGASSRRKRFLIGGIELEELERRLAVILAPSVGKTQQAVNLEMTDHRPLTTDH
jgi:uncharacterized protein (TIGR00251 family)